MLCPLPDKSSYRPHGRAALWSDWGMGSSLTHLIDEEVKPEQLPGEPRLGNFGPVLITGRWQRGWAFGISQNCLSLTV